MPFRTTLPCRLLPALLIFLAADALAVCDPPDVFHPRVQYQAGLFAVSAVEGDFDGDTHLDLAVANLESHSVTVFLGDGQGAFTFAGQTPAVTSPRGIAAGDFDGDGILDLAVTGVFQKLYLLKGTGFGTFSLYNTLTLGFENRGIVATDLDADGILDLVIASRTSVSVLIGNGAGGLGDGSFGAPTGYPTPSSWGVAVADFDGDGAKDIAAGNWLHTQVTLLFGDVDGANVPDGTFTPGGDIPAPGGCSDITAGDATGDGIIDLVASGSSGVWVFAGGGAGGVGDGTFTVTPYFTGTQSNDAAIADVDGDGDPDIAVSDTDAQTLRVLFNDGAGGFGTSWSYLSGTGPIGVVLADFSEDGRIDAAVVNSASSGFPGTVSVFISRCGDPEPVPEPVIDDVRDVPGDQGGRVFVTWYASAFDAAGSGTTITGYRVWRRVPPALAPARAAGSFAGFDPAAHDGVTIDNGTAIEFWEPLETLPAAFLAGYGYTAPTTQDSTAMGNPLTAFFVQALTPNPGLFFNSAPDSGYSVDNLAPPAPAPFTAVYSAGGTALHWGPSRAPDFALFRLHRGPDPGFEPGPDNLVTAQPDTGYHDPTGGVAFYYKLAAVDVHGNVGRYAIVSPDAATATLMTLVSAIVEDDRAVLTWYVSSDEPATWRVERRTADSGWLQLGETLPDGAGFVRWTDAGLEAGARYAYRLRMTAGPLEHVSGEAWVEIPGGSADAAVWVPNPVVRAGITVSFSPPSGAVARIELVDVSGRVLARRTVAGTGSRQIVALTRAGEIAPGLYFVRMDAPRTVRRVAVVR